MGPPVMLAALLAPCASRRQALLTALCFGVLSLGALGAAYACFLFAHSARQSIAQMDFPDWRSRNRSGLDAIMYIYFGFGALLGLVSVFLGGCGVIVAMRSISRASDAA